jgi:hypothetical protein
VWNQQARLFGTGAIGEAAQGVSVALSADGNTALVGGYYDNGGVGATWVFTRIGGTLWSQQAKLVGTGAVGGAQQGTSVALSADGNIALVGGASDNSGAGAAWVFTRSGGVWSQLGSKLVGNDAVGAARQGTSVTLSADGNRAIVGGPYDNSRAGAAWVFTRTGAVWSQLGSKLVGNDAAGPTVSQGQSVAMSCNIALVGGPRDNNSIGAAWVFAAPPNGTHDFNRDCRSDILWWNRISGQVVSWFLDGAFVIGGGSPGSVGTPWAIVGQSDFNGDGYADLLLRNGTTGETMIWLLNGSSIIASGSTPPPPTEWTVAGTGDFNGDGFGDVLWYNASTGQVVLWFMKGTSQIGGGSPGSREKSWTISTGDFNGDGKTDILWRNSITGQVEIWFLNGITVTSTAGFVGPDADWTIGGIGDFNGDGISDILWYDGSTGQVVIWLLDGATLIGEGSPGSVLTNFWTLGATGDYNGDGKSDILWWNIVTGQVVLWFIDGAAVVGGGSPGGASFPWQIQGLNAD